MNLVYDISVIGEQNVRRALRGVEAELSSSARRAQAAVSSGRQPGSATARQATEREAIQAARRVERETVAAQRRVAKEEFSSVKRSERERIAAERRIERERIASEKAVGREQLRQEKYWADARARARQKDHQDREAKLTNRRSTISSVAGGVGNSVRSAIGTVAGIGGTVLGVAGLAGAGEAVTQEIDLDRRVRQTVVNARGAGETGEDPRKIRNQIRGVAKSTGASESSLMGGVEAYVGKTGDLSSAMSNLQAFASVAMATGSAVEDISSSAADMSKLGITSVGDMTQALATLAMQGRKGSFELKDMAREFPEILATAAKNGVRGLSGLTQLGGMLQVVQHATGNASESTTALNQMSNQLIAKNADLSSGKALGGRKVEVFTDKTHHTMRDQRDILGDVLEGSRGDIAKLNDLFEIRGSKAFSGFTTTYNTKYDAARKGGASDKEASTQGRAAALAMLDDASKVAGTWADIQRDAAEVAKSDAVKLEKINTQLREAFATKLLPALERLMPKFEALIPKISEAAGAFADFIGWFSNNPIKGVGAMVLGKIALDLAGAGIGAAVKAALVSMLAPGAGGSTAGAVIGGAVGMGGRAVTGIAGGATAALGAGGALVASGAAAAGGLALAGYAGKQLYDVTEGFSDFGGGGGRALTPEEYDAKRAAGGLPGGGGDAAAAAAQKQAAMDLSAAAKDLSAAAKAAGPPASRTSPIVSRNN